MRRAQDLATLGIGRVSPNPQVGCVVVFKEQIIGEGWHRKYGGPHAEVNAINSVKDRRLLPDSVLYVNLEPCSHQGKTPPCTELIISSGIKKVVVSNTDPNPMVSGKGISRLRDQGVEVVEKVLETEGSFLNRRFFTFHRQRRPYIILKWAQTMDGFIAHSNYDSKWISGECSRQLVHKYRSQEDAIMVGRNTAQYDNPKLTSRHWKGNNPVRIVLDSNLRLNRDINLFDGSVQTLCYNLKQNLIEPNVEWVQVSEDRFLEDLLDDLYHRNIQSLLIEGGARLLGSMISAGYWNEARVFTSTKNFGKGIKAPIISTQLLDERLISGDTLRIYSNASN